MKRALLRLCLIVLLIVAATVAVTFMATHRSRSVKLPGPQAGAAAPAIATVETSGEILGVRIGSSLEETRAKLELLRDPATDAIREKKERGRQKMYWKLAHPEYSWIMVRPNSKGRITQISAFLKPETPKPFDQIGDLKRAATHLDNMAVWNVNHPTNISYRLIAKGANHQAANIILIATPPE